MKSKLTVLLLLVAFIFIVNSMVNVKQSEADGVQPGSADDPVVTKSYVDQQIKQEVTAQVQGMSGADAQAQIAAEVQKQVAAQVAAQVAVEVQQQIAAEVANLQAASAGGGSSANLTTVKLLPGQQLMAGTGSEFIVRTGFTIAIGTDNNGIPDVTGGKDIAIGSAITTNHLLIFPTEFRGIKPDPKKSKDIYVMVRGSYTLTNADGSAVTPAP